MWEKNRSKIGKIVIVIAAITLVTAMFSGCLEGGSRDITVTITGSSTVLPIAAACAEEFNARHDDVQVTVSSGGSGHGIRSVASGEADIGDASREAKPGDVDEIPGVSLSDLVDHRIAVDGVAVIVSKAIYDAGITDLTSQQVTDIYTGTITNWNEVGGPDKEIVVNEREEGSGTRDTFMDALGLESTQADNAHAGNSGVKQAVKNNDQAIGYVGLGYVGTDTPAVKLDGVESTDANIKSGDYPITRSLHMYTLGQARGETLDFINFVLSPEGQDIVEEEGFIRMFEAPYR